MIQKLICIDILVLLKDYWLLSSVLVLSACCHASFPVVFLFQGARHPFAQAVGRNIANPTAMLLSAANMLRHLKWVNLIGPVVTSTPPITPYPCILCPALTHFSRFYKSASSASLSEWKHVHETVLVACSLSLCCVAALNTTLRWCQMLSRGSSNRARSVCACVSVCDCVVLFQLVLSLSTCGHKLPSMTLTYQTQH